MKFCIFNNCIFNESSIKKIKRQKQLTSTPESIVNDKGVREHPGTLALGPELELDAKFPIQGYSGQLANFLHPKSP